jgi:hypothetical protein
VYTECRMAKPKRSAVQENVSLRLFGDEAKRWIEVMRRARTVDHNANKTDVIRALLRLPPDSLNKREILTEKDRRYFIGKDKQGAKDIGDINTSPEADAGLNEGRK